MARKFYSPLVSPDAAAFSEVFDRPEPAIEVARRIRVKRLLVLSVKDGRLVRETMDVPA